MAATNTVDRLRVSLFRAEGLEAVNAYSVTIERLTRARAKQTATSEAVTTATPTWNKAFRFTWNKDDPEPTFFKFTLYYSSFGKWEVGTATIRVRMDQLGQVLRVSLVPASKRVSLMVRIEELPPDPPAKSVEATPVVRRPRLRHADFVPICKEVVSLGNDVYESLDEMLLRVDQYMAERPHVNFINVQTMIVPSMAKAFDNNARATLTLGRKKFNKDMDTTFFQIVRVWYTEGEILNNGVNLPRETERERGESDREQSDAVSVGADDIPPPAYSDFVVVDDVMDEKPGASLYPAVSAVSSSPPRASAVPARAPIPSAPTPTATAPPATPTAAALTPVAPAPAPAAAPSAPPPDKRQMLARAPPAPTALPVRAPAADPAPHPPVSPLLNIGAVVEPNVATDTHVPVVSETVHARGDEEAMHGASSERTAAAPDFSPPPYVQTVVDPSAHAVVGEAVDAVDWRGQPAGSVIVSAPARKGGDGSVGEVQTAGPGGLAEAVRAGDESDDALEEGETKADWQKKKERKRQAAMA